MSAGQPPFADIQATIESNICLIQAYRDTLELDLGQAAKVDAFEELQVTCSMGLRRFRWRYEGAGETKRVRIESYTQVMLDILELASARLAYVLSDVPDKNQFPPTAGRLAITWQQQ